MILDKFLLKEYTLLEAFYIVMAIAGFVYFFEWIFKISIQTSVGIIMIVISIYGLIRKKMLGKKKVKK